MNPPARLETPRLRLRAPAADDAKAIFEAYTQDMQVARYTTWSPHRCLKETEVGA
jgi:RimJ/RimL family protein N-acetyltransferase